VAIGSTSYRPAITTSTLRVDSQARGHGFQIGGEPGDEVVGHGGGFQGISLRGELGRGGVHRFVGSIATISGVEVTMVWLVLPPASARSASVAILITFMILALGRKLVQIATYRPHPPLPL
jgi:hypothetical protein